MPLQQSLSIITSYISKIQGFGGFEDALIQGMVAGTAGLFIFVSINLSSVLKLLDRFYREGRWDIRPVNAIEATFKVTAWLSIALISEILLFFTTGPVAILLFSIALLMLILSIDASMGVLEIVYNEVKSIAEDNQKSNDFFDRDWKRFQDETEKDLSKYDIEERELLAYEHIYPYDKEEKFKSQVRPYHRLCYFIYFFSNEYKKYEEGVPIDWLTGAISTSQMFERSSQDEIKEKLMEMVDAGMLDLVEDAVDYRVKITEGDEREEIMEVIGYMEKRKRLDAEVINESTEIVEENIPPRPTTRPTYFLQPVFGIKHLLNYLLYKLKGGNYTQEHKQHVEEYWEKLEDLRKNHQ